MERVTGIGGVFFKSKDPTALKAWYVEHLGIELDAMGYVAFKWAEPHRAPGDEPGMTIWNPFPADTTYFSPSASTLMINYRVRDLGAMLAQLQSHGIALVGEPLNEEYGRFAWIMDPEGNKIELWEPPSGAKAAD